MFPSPSPVAVRWSLACLLSVPALTAQDPAPSGLDLDDLPVVATPVSEGRPNTDWLLDPTPFRARLGRSADGKELVLDNGLIRRSWRLAPNLACVGFDDLVAGRSLLRAVRPEAMVTVNRQEGPVGGLLGQPNHAWTSPEWLDQLRVDPRAMRFVGFEQGPLEPRLEWKRGRHAAPDAVWPPGGVHVRFDFEPPDLEGQILHNELLSSTATGPGDGGPYAGPAPASDDSRRAVFTSDMNSLEGWEQHVSASHPRSSVANEGQPGAIYTPANSAAFVSRTLPAGTRLVEATFDVGTDESASWGPGLALVFADRTIKLNLRPGGDAYDGTLRLGTWNGGHENPGFGVPQNFDRSKPWSLRLRITPEGDVLCDARVGDGRWGNYGRIRCGSDLGNPKELRIGKLDVQGGDSDFGDPGELVRCRILGCAAYGPVDRDLFQVRTGELIDLSLGFRVSVHYALYDGIPALSKWIEVHNDRDEPITVDAFESEILALVEHDNPVEAREGVPIPRPQNLHVETDFAFGGFTHDNANRHVIHWRTDPEYTTQVNYLRQQPCLMVSSPTRGPAQRVAPGATFTSHRTFELAFDSLERERRSLAQRRLYRTIAPWITENPLMMHMRDSAPERVRAAIDQCAEVGFEMLILSFGSGFDMENEDPAYLRQWREVTEYAHAKDIEIGGYSLFSSRHIGGGNDIVSPEGERPTHGNCPAVTSEWGQRYMAKLYAFFEQTGFDLLEHDGPYPGDVDVTGRPPLQQGIDDSRWVQWRIVTEFYEWCRAQGIYVNAPDHYFLNGTSKVGMGYREVNWSLPRDQQVIHTRQNIFDGTWKKPPSLGWMFVPLTQYHGGGAAATIEPLAEHLDHYDRMLTSNLALGVQACYRGPRLYDTDATRELVAGRVEWFKAHRDILESDVVHGRRADGRDVDWMLHVNPHLETPGMLVVFNPLPDAVERTLPVDLYYTGLRGSAQVAPEGGESFEVALNDGSRARIPLRVPGRGFTWALIESGD